MARGDESRGQEHKSGPRARGAAYVGGVMGGTGDEAPDPRRSGPAPAAQMHSGAQGSGQPRVARDDEA